MTSTRKQGATAAAITLVNIAVAISVNLLTSSWSWLIFVILALLSATWVALEARRAAPRQPGVASPAPRTTPGAFVPRPELTNQIVRSLLGSKTRKVGITTGLAGAGGFGKTTLAAEVCARPEIRDAFAWIDWVTVGQEVRGAALADTINDITERIDGQRPGLTSPEQAGIRLGESLKGKGRSLLVVDDVWSVEQLRPFLSAGRGCTLLVTTRIPDLLPDDAETVEVDQMSQAQARELVTGGLADLPESVGERLLDITGRWPLALGLANATLRRAARDGADVADAADRLLRRLTDLGPAALDVTDAARRDRAVAATLESSLGVLGGRRDRFVELAIFPEDTEIPVELAVLLWQKTAGLSTEDADRLCHELAELSLITWRGTRSTLRLHDVIRTYLRHECGAARLTELHDSLLDAVASTLPEPDGERIRWWTLPASADYLWRNLAYHLDGAQRSRELSELVTAPHWVIGKLRRFGPVAVAEDLALVETDESRELSRFLDQSGHLLVPSTPDHAVVNALAQRLPHSPYLDGLRHAAESAVQGMPRLIPERAMPDLPDPALVRVLEGHEGRTGGCAFAPNKSWLVTSASDGIRVWNPESGQLIQVLEGTGSGHFSRNIALSPDGRTLAVEHIDDLIQLWNTATWQPRTVLRGHKDFTDLFCFSADGKTIVSASDDHTIRVWDTETGDQLRTLKTREAVHSIAYGPDETLVTMGEENLKVWDLATGGHLDLPSEEYAVGRCVAVSHDRKWAAVPGLLGVTIHELLKSGQSPRTLRHATDLTAAAFSPDGRTLATGSNDGLVVLWCTHEWRPIDRIAAHGSRIEMLAFTSDGSLVATTGDDGTVRLWNPAKARGELAREEAVSGAGYAIAPDGSWLAAVKAESIVIHDPVTGVTHEFKKPGYVARMIAVGRDHLALDQFNDIVVCEAGNWQSTRTLRHPGEGRIRALSAGGNLVCAIDYDHRVALWDITASGAPVVFEADAVGVRVRKEPLTDSKSMLDRLGRRFRSHTKSPRNVTTEVAPDGGWLAFVSGKAVHVVRPPSWEPLTSISFDEEVDGAKSTPDGRWLVIKADETVQYWDTESWTLDRELTAISDAESSTASAWSPDSSLLATLSDDRTLRIHDGRDWTRLTELRLDGELSDCSWLTNNRLLVSGGHGLYWFTYEPGSV